MLQQQCPKNVDTLVQVEQCVCSISLQNSSVVDTDLSECSSFQARKLYLFPALPSFTTHFLCRLLAHLRITFVQEKNNKERELSGLKTDLH